ncbi:tRNA (adenosine(37)-N6)-dimethylallyltransferase MiaA [Thermithiobacillus plumbiphilus]|uniref:tRNA dimethylallyltransferase n=1 Tax=Thermithiobacillus plumbiphilus TaxID=1729899 RepID=A0ABU9DCZ7_9PROT
MTAAYPAIFLMGPTASGKTDLAIALADRLPVDIISVDSALVYRGMDIGTAKPDPALRQSYPHALIDIRDPSENYCAGDFRRDALACMAATRARGRIPLLVGGTGLYFRALEQGLIEIPPIPAALRDQLRRRLALEGARALHTELARHDPLAASRIHPNDSQRITRALEVWQATGRPLSAWQQRPGGDRADYRYLKLVLAPPRDLLYERIGRRLAQMSSNGFPEEVQRLWRQGLDPELPAMRAVGYRQLLAWCRGEMSLDAALAAALQATRQLAKRQLTWLRGETGCELLDTSMSVQIAEQVARRIRQFHRETEKSGTA